MTPHDLERRLIRLERRCRRLQLAALGLGALLTAACLSAALAPASDVLRAQRLELVNAAGDPRGALELDGTTPRLVLASPENRALVALSAGASVLERPHGLAGLALAASSCVAELVANEGAGALWIDGSGPTVKLMAAAEALDGGPGAGLSLVAEDSDADGDFGHADLVASRAGATLELGRNDVQGIELDYADGKPALAMQDATEAVVFRAS